MKVLIIGSGGREHALAWKIAQSQNVKQLFVAPGNAGISEIAKCVDIKADDIDGLVKFASDKRIDLTVIGPEVPLVAGIVDKFQAQNMRVFGPTALSARLEGSKVFAKQVMLKAGVPTAGCKIFDEAHQAKEYINTKDGPIVVKADGLAAGKGVIVAKDKQEALEAVTSIMEEKIFGDAGNQVIIEDCLQGQEVSLLVLCDGKDYVLLATSQDHKRIFDNDEGPNTGGMGAYSPAPIISDELMQNVKSEIIEPVLAEMAKIGSPYKGVLYAGLMITEKGPKVLEFNVRFGDPETQAILPRLNTDLVELMEAVIDGKLDKRKLSWKKEACVCVVLSSGGYPGKYHKGKEIKGADSFRNSDMVVVFYAGAQLEDKKIVTSGGRVLGVTALGKDIKTAITNVYDAVKAIEFEGMHYRRDIGLRAIKEA